ncbi:AraC family transcriptional regulator [Paenibacillus sp. NEAU-GSW1]|uniref:AraC family transcriptional regulator n=1 Tax=Paenibacillus sp. NEAU-GSW1 TaxID=2682486 RepID=UPI0012E2C8DB|nr:AraC family transcriptional regulator [Paenibacillus sp. NEAU-GSW1]MUT67605.1 helix-turn-helix domain-containing protein [Paenibacillus sp. NEAU-GSW1]
MSAFDFRSNGKLFSRLLLSITLCIVLTLTVSSLIYFFTYVRIDLKQAYQSDVSNLSQTSKEVIGMTESAQALSFQIYRTYTISKLMFYSEPNIYDETAAMNELTNYLSSMPFIESIYVYNSKSNRFYTTAREGESGIFNRDELPDKKILVVLDNFQQYRPFTPIPRSYTTPTLAGEKTYNVYTYLGYDAIGRSQTINSAVIVNISSAWINKEIGAITKDDQGKSYIMDDQERLLSGDTLSPKELSAADRELLEKQIRDQETGYIVAEFEGKKSLISYTKPDSLDWQYVRVTPYKNITATVSSIRNMTILIAMAILVIGLLTSWLLSRMLYLPIHQIVNQMNMLESEKRNSSYTIRQNLLRKFIQGVQSLNTQAQLDKLALNGIKFDFHSNYRVVLIKIDRFESLKESRGDDLLAYKFAIMNISWEIGLTHYQVESVDMDDDCVVILLNPIDPEEQHNDELLRSVLKNIQQSTMDYLKIGVSMTYSVEANAPSQLTALYKQVKEAALHRLFIGHGGLIRAEDILSLKSKEYVFPADKEKRMADALMASKTEDAKKVFIDIVQETADYPFQVAQLAVSHLTMTINNILSTIQKNNSLESDAATKFKMPTLDKFETIDELNEMFFTMFNDIQSRLAEKRTMKQGDLIRKINDLIHKEYANPNMCLNWIASELDMSSIYISRVYKQQTLHAIVDVINTVRLDKAKEHLEQTDSSIADIAEKTGYTSSSYFHRMFKKSFGVTPADYRKVKQG